MRRRQDPRCRCRHRPPARFLSGREAKRNVRRRRGGGGGFSLAEPFVPSGDACGRTFPQVKRPMGQSVEAGGRGRARQVPLWFPQPARYRGRARQLPSIVPLGRRWRVSRQMPCRNQTLVGRSPNAPSPSVSATSPSTLLGPTPRCRRYPAKAPSGREAQRDVRCRGVILASPNRSSARGCQRADVPPPPGQTDKGLVPRIHNIAVDLVGPHTRDVVVPPRPLPFCGFWNWAWRQGAGGAQGNSLCGSLSPRGIEGAHGNSLRLSRWGDVDVRQTRISFANVVPIVSCPSAAGPTSIAIVEGGSRPSGVSRQLSRSFCPGMPVGRRCPRSNGQGSVARCPVAIKR